MLAAHELVETGGQCFRCQLCPHTPHADQLGPAGEQFRHAAFIGVDMRLPVAQNRAMGRHEGR